MDNTPLDQARQALLAAQRILVTSHIRPDGDAIGSLLGLGLSLKEAGKQVQMILSDGVPAAFRFLEGSQQIRKKPEGDFDLSVVLDCSDFERSGSALNGHPTPDLNIDHHPTNLSFARINLIEQPELCQDQPDRGGSRGDRRDAGPVPAPVRPPAQQAFRRCIVVWNNHRYARI